MEVPFQKEIPAGYYDISNEMRDTSINKHFTTEKMMVIEHNERKAEEERKRKAKALYAQSKEYEQAVKTQLISGVANLYYTLLMLDSQYEVTEEKTNNSGVCYKQVTSLPPAPARRTSSSTPVPS